MIRVLVNGAKGKMGLVTVATVKADAAFTLVGETGRQDDLVQSIRESKADVVVDVTNASVGYENFLKIIEAGAHPVIGTSGFTQEHVVQLSELCASKKIGGLIAPNFSIGALLMMKFAREAAHYMTHAEIIEAHHEQKQDAPSGTAIRTAEMIREGLGVREASTTRSEELVAGARGGRVGDVPIHSLRLTGVLAKQQVVFGALGETLTIEHNSISRESFMGGINLAIRKVIGTQQLYYGLEKLIFPSEMDVPEAVRQSPETIGASGKPLRM